MYERPYLADYQHLFSLIAAIATLAAVYVSLRIARKTTTPKISARVFDGNDKSYIICENIGPVPIWLNHFPVKFKPKFSKLGITVMVPIKSAHEEMVRSGEMAESRGVIVEPYQKAHIIMNGSLPESIYLFLSGSITGFELINTSFLKCFKRKYYFWCLRQSDIYLVYGGNDRGVRVEEARDWLRPKVNEAIRKFGAMI